MSESRIFILSEAEMLARCGFTLALPDALPGETPAAQAETPCGPPTAQAPMMPNPARDRSEGEMKQL